MDEVMCVEDGTRTTLIMPLILADEIRVYPRSFPRCQRAISFPESNI
jgi:hypothetical protein